RYWNSASSACSAANSEHFNGKRDAITTAQTQGGDAALQAAILQRVEQRRQHARAAGANRMTEGNRAAVHVHFALVEPELIQNRDGLDRECLVQLDEVDVAQ